MIGVDLSDRVALVIGGSGVLRYVHGAGTIELLCIKTGKGMPATAGELLQLKEAKALPSSD